MFVIGTAGHVDHGKSTLIKALTGIDPDRLREEKERQMTIDLGFAWLKLPSGEEVGIVDVPGHRDFIDNMLAGAGGIDAVLFIIAADEGIMPQSREHLSILELLEIKHGLIVLTKTDLVSDQEWFDLIKSDVKQFAAGTFLANSPIVEVSSTTGKGLKELLGSIDTMLKKCEPKRDIQRPRLPIDRVFTLKGFGTVVTGTMLDGQFSVGQQVEILPQKLQTRIRGIQSHKKKAEVTAPGSRTALNLIGVDVSEIERGNVVAQVGTYSPTQRVDVRFTMLEDTQGILSHDDLVKLYCGTSQSIARVRVIGNEAVLPGEKGWLQLELKDAITVANGDHFILRKPSPGETLGGGVILNENPGKRIKRFSEHSLDHFNLLETGITRDILYAHLQIGNPITIQALSEKTGFSLEIITNEVAKMLDVDLEVLEIQSEKILSNSLVTTKTNWKKLTDSLLGNVREYHIKFPLRQGISKDELRRAVGLSPRLFGMCTDLLINKNQLSEQGDVIFLPGHLPEFNNEDKKAVNELLAKMELSPYSPPPLANLKNEFGPEIIQALINKGLLVQTSDDIAFRQKEFDLMLSGLREFIMREGSIALNQFRDKYQTSRKYALSFLEYLDKKGITARDGDRRVIRAIDKG
ncbi:MAG: selenocysteine-specific translation elongation factor [Pelolinea sp.]|nr:selenocysteine-specific translation elongation factor [Pelolinea sp.]